MQFNIKIRSSASTEGLSDTYELFKAHDLLKGLALHDRQELDDDTLFALYQYLTSGRAPAGSLQLSQLDGFLTAVTASRDGVAVLDWMPVVWGGGEPKFENMAEAELILTAVTRLYRRIEDGLAAEGGPIPILGRSPDDRILAGSWCRGFLQGVWTFAGQWSPAFFCEEAQRILFPISTVAGHESLYRLHCSRGRDQHWSRSPDFVMTRWHPFCPEDLKCFWADWRLAVRRPEQSMRNPGIVE